MVARVIVLLFSLMVVARGSLPDFPMTFNEMKIKAGYYTENGKYRGGLPKADALELEIYECLEYTDGIATIGNATAIDVSNDTITCIEWRADESGGGTFELGSCTCKYLQGNEYCGAWTCNQITTDSDCNTSGDCLYDSNTDAVLCMCDVENESGRYCDAWSCRQIDSDGREEFEDYTCVRESDSGHFCDAWTGTVNSTDEIEVTT